MIRRYIPEDGFNKLTRNFLADGTRRHQFLKSSKDILFSELASISFEKVPVSRNMLIGFSSEADEDSASFLEDT